MNKKILWVIIIVLIVLGLVGYGIFMKKDASVSNPATADAKNATYILDGSPVTLKDGVSEVEATPGSASKIVTQYFGNEVTHDFNGDGREDVAFILTQNTGGSGTFYYVVAALNTANGYVGSQGFLLGDRIAPQTTEMGDGNIVVVNYADRKPEDSFATPPSVGKTVQLQLNVNTMQLEEVPTN